MTISHTPHPAEHPVTRFATRALILAALVGGVILCGLAYAVRWYWEAVTAPETPDYKLWVATW